MQQTSPFENNNTIGQSVVIYTLSDISEMNQLKLDKMTDLSSRPYRAIVLLFTLRMIRNIGYGIFSCIFFEYLFQKAFKESSVLMIMMLSLAGEIFLSALSNKMDRVDSGKLLLQGYVLKIISGVAFTYSQNVMYIILANIAGFLPVTGNDNLFLAQREQRILENNIEKSISQPKQLQFKKYFTVAGKIGKVIGCAFVFLFIQKYNGAQCFNLELSLPFLSKIYCYLCLTELILCFLLKVATRQPSESVQSHRKTAATNPWRIVFKSLSSACLTHTFLAFFIYQRYLLSFSNLCFILAGRSFLPVISPVARYISLKIFGKTITRLFFYISNVLLLMMLTTLARTITAVGPIYLLVSVFLAEFKIQEKDNQTSEDPVSQTSEYSVPKSTRPKQINEQFWTSMGLMVGVSLNGYFMLQPSYSILFAFPFAYSAGIKIVLLIQEYAEGQKMLQAEKVGVAGTDIQLNSISSPKPELSES